MVDQNTIRRFGKAAGMLVLSLTLLLAVYACGKNEADQSAAQPASDTVKRLEDTVDNVTHKTKAVTKEAVKSAGEMVDKASQGAKDAYNAAESKLEETVENATDAVRTAGEQ